MRFRYYTLIVLGDTTGFKKTVESVSETRVRVLQQEHVLICTFSSNLEAAELGDLFDSEKKTYFIFEFGEDVSVSKIGRDDIHQKLFGYIENGGTEVVNMMTSELKGEINGSTKASGETAPMKVVEEEVEEIDLSKLSKQEKDDMIDVLLDKGLENLNEKDRELLDLLSKKK